MSPREFNVSLTGGAPYGMRIKGGSEFSMPISIESVSPGSKAQCAGLTTGDVVLSINGTDVSKATHDRAKELIIQAKDVLILTLVRHSAGDFPQITSITRSTQDTKVETKPTQANTQTTPSKTDTQSTSIKPQLSTEKAAAQTSANTTFNQSTSFKPQTSIDKTVSHPQSTYVPRQTAPQETKDIPRLTTTFENKATPQQSNSSSFQSTSVQKEPAKPSGSTNVLGNLVTSRDNVKYEPYRPDADKPTGNIQHVKIANKSVGVCQKCNQTIGNENHVKLGDKLWHTNHFTCSICDKNIASEGFFEEGEKAICKNCFEDIFAQKCSKCSKALTGQYVTASGKSYHKECFLCEKCKKVLSGQSFNHHEDKTYCIDCLSDILSIKCDNCNKPIRPNDSYIGALGKSFHVGCLLCSICGTDLSNTGKFQVKDNKPCCPHHV